MKRILESMIILLQTEKVETIESSVETENQTEETELQEPVKPQNPNVKWYILQAYSGYEGRVEQTIREKLRIKGLEHLVDEIFIPSEDIIRTKEGKETESQPKIFSRICTDTHGVDT